MNDYIIHLANLGDLRGDKAAVLSSIDWRHTDNPVDPDDPVDPDNPVNLIPG